MAKVASGRFQKEFGYYRSIAHREAVTVTSHGRDDVVLLSALEYKRLRSLERSALHVTELSSEDIASIKATPIPLEASRYDHEVP